MTKKIPVSPDNDIKELIADSKLRIKLHDYVMEKSGFLIKNTAEELFPLNISKVEGEFGLRLKRYEDISSELMSIMSLLGYWGTPEHLLSISIPAKQFSLELGSASLTNVWTALRWYPAMLLTYSLGIGAVAAGNYRILHNFLQSSCKSASHSLRHVPLVLAMEESFGHARDLFKSLPGHERQHTPVSEYLFGFFNDTFNKVVFLGEDYENVFDRFEMLYAFQHSHEREKHLEGHFWGPVGRFGWKSSRESMPNPFKSFCDEAAREKEFWQPLEAGFFDGSYERYKKIEQYYLQRLPKMY